jgi:hypothetical protein
MASGTFAFVMTGRPTDRTTDRPTDRHVKLSKPQLFKGEFNCENLVENLTRPGPKASPSICITPHVTKQFLAAAAAAAVSAATPAAAAAVVVATQLPAFQGVSKFSQSAGGRRG